MLLYILRIVLVVCFILIHSIRAEGPFYFESTLESNDFITNWLLLGPFSNSTPGTQSFGEHGAECYGYHNDLLIQAGGESEVSPGLDQTIHSSSQESRAWHSYFSLSPWIDFNSIFYPSDDVIAYAFVIINVDQDIQVNLGLSHNDGMKIWLNGKMVYEEHRAQIVLNSVSLPVMLTRGDNRLLVKIDEKTGGWGFALSVQSQEFRQENKVLIKVPATNDVDTLQEILFEASSLQDSEPAAGQTISLRFSTENLLLPRPVSLPLVLIDTQGQPVQRQTLRIGKQIQSTYPLQFILQDSVYQLALEDRPDIATKSLTVVAKKVFNRDTEEEIGQRPYEMGNRPGHIDPLIDFEDLQDWWIQAQKGASVRLYRSRRQQMDSAYVARVIYQGKDGSSAFTFGPPNPIPIPADADNVGIWIYGNNWGWVPDLTTPQVGIQIILEDDQSREYIVSLGRVNWKEWFLCQRPFQFTAENLYFKGIRILGCSNLDERELFFDSVKFFHEDWPVINLARLPDMLPFLTTEATIVPIPEDSVDAHTQFDGRKYTFMIKQNIKPIQYEYNPTIGTLSDISIKLPDAQVIQPFLEGDIQFQISAESVINGHEAERSEERMLERVERAGDQVVYYWIYRNGNFEIPYRITISSHYNSMIIDLSVDSDQVLGLQLGRLKSSEACKLVRIPMLTYGLPDPQVVCSAGVFIFALLDHYRSHASTLYAVNEVFSEKEVRFNGGCRYNPKTDGRRNPLKERIVLTVSPNFHDVLPNIPHPPSPMGRITRSRLWKENWGMPADSTAHDKFYWGLKLLRHYGISQFIVRHHEETWRDGGESFTLRLEAAPKKGGDQSLIDYVKRVKELGFVCGLYTNYIDFAPVNANWSNDRVARLPDGSFVKAWPRCYTLKPALAPIFEAEYAPAIHEKFGPNTVYCDVHTAVAPWERVDYDARVPEAGMLRGQHKDYSLVLNNEKNAYKGPVFSEGLYHWFYAGLTDGNYGQLKDSRPSEISALVDFDLLRIHPLEVDIGMGGPFMFYPGGVEPQERNSRSNKFDRFIATTIAYGHNGYLIDIPTVNDSIDTKGKSSWGIPAILKSYYMMQQLQTRYALKRIEKILYFDGKKWLYTSDAIRDDSYLRSQIRVRYEDGLETLVNLNKQDTLTTLIGDRVVTLPPNGYAAAGQDLWEISGLLDGRRVDVVQAPDYIYADGRGKLLQTEHMAVTNSAVILKDKGAIWLIPIDEQEKISFNEDILSFAGIKKIEGCDRNGNVLDSEVDFIRQNGWVTVRLSEVFFKYRLTGN